VIRENAIFISVIHDPPFFPFVKRAIDPPLYDPLTTWTLQHPRIKVAQSFLNFSSKINQPRKNSTDNDTFYPFNPILLTGIVQRHDGVLKERKGEIRRWVVYFPLPRPQASVHSTDLLLIAFKRYLVCSVAFFILPLIEIMPLEGAVLLNVLSLRALEYPFIYFFLNQESLLSRNQTSHARIPPRNE